MKYISKISIFCIMLFSVSIFAQKSNWQQAPLNFIPDSRLQDAQQVSGDVYSIDNLFYDRNGLYIGTAAGELIENRNWTASDINEKDFPGVLRAYDVNNNLTKLSFYKDGAIDVVYEYKYNGFGLVIEALTDGITTSTYAYDEKNRLSTFTNLNPLNPHTKRFSYKQVGDLIKVTQIRISIQNKKEKKETSELHFQNGLEVYNSEKNIQNTYELDNHGNWISKTYQQNNEQQPRTQRRFITYYSERPKAEAISLIKEYKENDSTKPYYSILVNNEPSNLFTISQISELNAIFIYNTITGDYFYALDDIKTQKSFKAKFNVKSVSAATPYIAIYNEKGIFILDKNRVFTNATITSAKLGDARVFYEKSMGITYFHLDKISKDLPIVPIEKVETEQTAFYLITNEKIMFLVDKGVSMFDDKKVEIKYLYNGNTVAVIDGIPKYILPPFNTITLNIIGQAKVYETGVLYDKVPEKE